MKKFNSNFFKNAEIWSRSYRVRSKNGTSVLCSPQAQWMFNHLFVILSLSWNHKWEFSTRLELNHGQVNKESDHSTTAPMWYQTHFGMSFSFKSCLWRDQTRGLLVIRQACLPLCHHQNQPFEPKHSYLMQQRTMYIGAFSAASRRSALAMAICSASKSFSLRNNWRTSAHNDCH